MLIYRTLAEVTAAGISDLSLAESAEHSSEQIGGSTHLADVFERRTYRPYVARVNEHGVGRNKAHLCAHRAKNIKCERDVADVGNVAYGADAVDGDRSENDGERRVFHSAYFNFSVKRLSATDH